MIYYQEPNAMLYQGHALDVLRGLSPESVDCVMTSPPYWGLRTYKTEPQIWGDNHCEHTFGDDIKVSGHHSGETNPGLETNFKDAGDGFDTRVRGNFCLKCHARRGELGLEPTIELYISHLILIFDEVKRVLKKTGTCWVNIDDSYNSGSGGYSDKYQGGFVGREDIKEKVLSRNKLTSTLPTKSLCLIPSRFALAMVEHGWILRNDIVWYKSNPMPESVKDRFTGTWEHLFFFVKSQRYWFEQQFENASYPFEGKWSQGSNKNYIDNQDFPARKLHEFITNGTRNKRDVWEINTQPYPEAHFATFPEKLCETPILSGCPSHICKKCGKAREKIYEFVGSNYPERKRLGVGGPYNLKPELLNEAAKVGSFGSEAIDKGYTDCGCNTGFEPGIVLDPFCGSGKALVVAKRLGRKAIGIDLNPDYCKLAVKEIGKIAMPMELA